MKHIVNNTTRPPLRFIAMICMFIFVNHIVKAQVTINIPAQTAIGYSLQDLSTTIYINSSGQKYNGCYAEVSADNLNSGQSFMFRTAAFDLPVGSSIPGYAVLVNSTLVKPSDDYYELEQKNKFPAGKYNLCINLHDRRGVLLTKECILLNILDVGNVILISPTDEEVLNTFTPVLSWMPVHHIGDGKFTYNIHIAELIEGQSYADAISFNPPLVYERDVPAGSFSYPSGAPALEDDKKYVWQVEVAMPDQRIIYSEVWMFQYKKKKQTTDTIIKKKSNIYPHVTRSMTSALYEFSDAINFKYDNYANDSLLTYTIKKAGHPDTTKSTPNQQVRLKPLVNYVSVPLPKDMDKQGKDAIYMLEIHNSRNEIWLLKFIINNKKTKG